MGLSTNHKLNMKCCLVPSISFGELSHLTVWFAAIVAVLVAIYTGLTRDFWCAWFAEWRALPAFPTIIICNSSNSEMWTRFEISFESYHSKPQVVNLIVIECTNLCNNPPDNSPSKSFQRESNHPYRMCNYEFQDLHSSHRVSCRSDTLRCPFLETCSWDSCAHRDWNDNLEIFSF